MGVVGVVIGDVVWQESSGEIITTCAKAIKLTFISVQMFYCAIQPAYTLYHIDWTNNMIVEDSNYIHE